MNALERKELVQYRLSKSKQTLDEVEVLIKNNFLIGAVNRIYYASFYAVSALLLNEDIRAKSHSGIKQMFSLHFIKAGIINEQMGNFYTFIFDMRQTGDYEDFVIFDKKEVSDLIPRAVDFIAQIEEILTKK